MRQTSGGHRSQALVKPVKSVKPVKPVKLVRLGEAATAARASQVQGTRQQQQEQEEEERERLRGRASGRWMRLLSSGLPPLVSVVWAAGWNFLYRACT